TTGTNRCAAVMALTDVGWGGGGGTGAGISAMNASTSGTTGKSRVTNRNEIPKITASALPWTRVEMMMGTAGVLGTCSLFPATRSNIAPSKRRCESVGALESASAQPFPNLPSCGFFRTLIRGSDLIFLRSYLKNSRTAGQGSFGCRCLSADNSADY